MRSKMAAVPSGCGVCRLPIKSSDSWCWCAQGCLFLVHGGCVSPECVKKGQFYCPDCWNGVREKRGVNLLTLADVTEQLIALRSAFLR